MPTIAEILVTALADLDVRTIWGVVGDALNPITDAIRREKRLEWIGVRHEETAAFAAGAQAQLSGTIGVCMGTVGPGSVQLLNGLYDARKSHAPVLAVCGQVPTSEIGSNFFQEVDNDLLFRDVAVYTSTITSPNQMPHTLEQAVKSALARQGVAVVTIPGDIGAAELPSPSPAPRFARSDAITVPGETDIDAAATALNDAKKVTLLVRAGARTARDEVLDLASTLQAPMVLTLKAKETLEHENPYAVGQTGLIGNPAANAALDACEVLMLIGTDFPYRQWYPHGKKVIQLDTRAEHIGRRTVVDI